MLRFVIIMKGKLCFLDSRSCKIYKIHVNHIVCGIFIWKFEYLPFLIDQISGTLPVIYKVFLVFLYANSLHASPSFYPHLLHITRSTCTIFLLYFVFKFNKINMFTVGVYDVNRCKHTFMIFWHHIFGVLNINNE